MKKTFFLSFVPPSKANRVKINSRAISKSGKRYIVPKDVALKINRAIWELNSQHGSNTPLFKVPVKVNITFILPNKRRRDLDNIMKTLGDCLVYANIIEDDNLIYIQELRKQIIKGEEGAIITIQTLKEKDFVNKKDLEKLKKFKEKFYGV